MASLMVVQERLGGWLVQELLVWSSSVRQLEGLADGGPEDAQRQAWWCPVVPGSHGAGDGVAVPAMVAQRRGWPHRAGSDGEDAACWPNVTVPSQAGVE
jgi:hypothetical protein